MTNPTLWTIILNYKTPDMTLQSVDAALREMAGISGQIIVVDNDSQDGSFETLEKAVADKGWDRVRVVQSGHNGGFGAGNNFGIQAGLRDGPPPDYIYILNSDAFPDPGAIRILLDYLETHPKVGFAGSNIHGPDGDWHCTIFRYPSIQSELEGAARTGPITKLFKNHVIPQPLPDAPKEVDWLAGASIMMRYETLAEIGLFDETFFLYFEETDLCRRAKLAGWPTVYVPDSKVTHIGSASTGMKTWKRKPQYWFDSRLHYFVKNHGRAYAVAATLAHVTGGLIWRLRCLIQRKEIGDEAHFLRDLITHGLRAAIKRAKMSAAQSANKNTPVVQPGQS
ncbi:glycosyltransferase family 2 protein [Yoonia sp. 2307UL14-13]|uniref:glycosyltransferase family 2 protein n=1 Tax=Yoonia sp. 2307UL14-13 TaxID=3126506 RepID=UPI00309FA516